jgi:nucleotide-binding universal stress UspA family protein
MTTFKHILVPTDFEPASKAALELAVSVARPFDAAVTLLHVWEVPVYPYMDFMVNSTLITNVEDAATQGLQSALEQLRKEMPTARAVLKHGEPWRTILEAIGELKPDLVVIGTHGRHGVSHTVLGSVAEKVVRLSDVPVLTIHAPKAR